MKNISCSFSTMSNISIHQNTSTDADSMEDNMSSVSQIPRKIFIFMIICIMDHL